MSDDRFGFSVAMRSIAALGAGLRRTPTRPGRTDWVRFMVHRTPAFHARSVAMTTLAAAFLLRVVGQVALVAGWAPWLPPLGEWQSGLLPYPALLAAQLVILAALALVLRDVRHGDRLETPGRFTPAVRGFAAVYAGSMLLRYVLTRAAHPEWGALGHTIPIWFHLALAAWLWVWAAGRAGEPIPAAPG